MSSTVTVTSTASVATKAQAPAQAPATIQTISTTLAGPSTSTHILIDDYWYDLTAWKACHPGGPLILEQMNALDSTDAFYSLHSAEAIARLARLPRSKAVPAAIRGKEPLPPTQAALNFRKLRAQLAKDGWFKPNLFWEFFYISSCILMAAGGTVAAVHGWTWTAITLIAFSMQQTGWVGHDLIHGRGTLKREMGYLLTGPINAFSRHWWSHKHNTHHVFTNYLGVDADVENDPVFHLFFPDEKDDVLYRKMQHWYFVPVASLLYFSWRSQSLQVAVASRQWRELAFFALNYFWLYQLGWAVALGSIYFAGFLVAIIVTATHQSEEMIDLSSSQPSEVAAPGGAYSFVECQFATTRDAKTSDPFTEWLWGGMQYQLEHHLFPIMPKYYYAQAAPIVEKFAKDNGLDYRVDTQIQILKRNINTLKFYAQQPPKEKKVQ
jgi:fatty acid desaturase